MGDDYGNLFSGVDIIYFGTEHFFFIILFKILKMKIKTNTN